MPEHHHADPIRKKIFGTIGNDDLLGSNGDDIIFGLRGNDAIFAGNGNDKVHGGRGDDLIDGGRLALGEKLDWFELGPRNLQQFVQKAAS